MKDIVFQIDEHSQGGLTAQAMGLPIQASAADVERLSEALRAAVCRHFADPAQRPQVMHLYFLCNGALASTCSIPL